MPVCYAPINVEPERGGGIGHRVGDFDISKKKYQNPHPRAKIIVKISRNKWFTSHHLKCMMLGQNLHPRGTLYVLIKLNGY